jgi:hypothetical protein
LIHGDDEAPGWKALLRRVRLKRGQRRESHNGDQRKPSMHAKLLPRVQTNPADPILPEQRAGSEAYEKTAITRSLGIPLNTGYTRMSTVR